MAMLNYQRVPRCQLITEWMDVGAEPRQLLDLLTERVPRRFLMEKS